MWHLYVCANRLIGNLLYTYLIFLLTGDFVMNAMNVFTISAFKADGQRMLDIKILICHCQITWPIQKTDKRNDD